jgi:geranylgeranyl reductase family protein
MGVWTLKQSHDVIVVGAGPAGATLACELAKQGIGVLILEKEKLPRYKCCAGGVTARAAKLLNLDISQVVEDTIHEVSFVFKLGNPFRGQHSEPLIYTVMRDAFDHLLVRTAQQLGATLMDGHKVTKIQVGPEWVEVFADSDVFRSQLVVGADGAYSVVARELTMSRAIEYLTAIESEIAVDGERLLQWKSRVQIDLGIIPGGYAWVFPKRNHLSIGVGCRASRAKDLNRRYQKFLSSLSIGNYTVSRSGSHLIPTCTQGMLIRPDRALLLGDAAGLTDPLTGEGIYYAIRSAQLAAPVIGNCLAKAGGGLQEYQQLVDEKIMSELRIARTLSSYFVRFPGPAFRMLSKRNGVWTAERNVMLGETDYSAVKEKIGGFKGILTHLLRF